MRDFLVEDESGRVILQQRKNAILLLVENQRETRVGLFRGTPESKALAFFQRHQVETRGYYEYVREAELEACFVEIVQGTQRVPTEAVEFCMRTLRWPGVRRAAADLLARTQDWRVKTAASHILEVYEDDWPDADLYELYRTKQ
jgi:hypothetical protein